MKILLSKIFRISGETVTEKVTAESEKLYGYRVIGSDVELRFLPHDRERFTVSGAGKILLGIPCSRCCKETPYEAELDFSYDVNRETKKDEDGEPVFFLDDENLDTEQLLETELSYVLPYTVLCKEDCKGLCPECGTDLNESTCDCANKPKMTAFGMAIQKAIDTQKD